MVRLRRGLVLAVILGAVFSFVFPQHSLNAQAGAAREVLSMSGFGEPAGPITASHLRMHQPLYLLDQMRQVKAGTLSPQLVAPLVGGESILNTLIARDLDSLMERLTAPEDLVAGPHPQPWRRILTDDGAAPPPPLDPIAPIAFAVGPGEVPAEKLRITSPIDGMLEVSLPAGVFRVNALRPLDGVIDNSPPMFGGDLVADIMTLLRWLTGPSLRPQFERTESPWTIPVQAGQDVDIEVGLVPGTGVPPAGLNSELTIRDATGTSGILWNVGVAALPLDTNIYVYVSGVDLKPLVLTRPVIIQTNVPQQPFLMPMLIAMPFPPSLVQGTVSLVSGPAGLSMAPVNFTLQPNGQVFLFPTLNITSGSPAATTFVLQNFSLRVSYHDVPILNSGSQTFALHYTVYPESRYWQTNASAQGVNCFRNITVFGTGTYASYGQCDNLNNYQAAVTETSSLGSIGIVFNDKTYFQPNTVKGGWRSGSFNPNSYANLLMQKLAAKWSVCTPFIVFC